MAEGYIVRLSLKDFMTFDDVTFLPSNRLNLVIGPNGSGKSSLSCAMVLGLAGKTKILGRAPEVGQFVKRGRQKAEIEIELYKKNNNNITVRRTMTIDNKTSWHLNDEPASQKEIEDLMKSLQIQVDNLCQFLPQDRVHDFAKMNKQELLDNTQKSVGSPKLYQMFNELKNNMKLDGTHEKDVQKIKDQILRSEDQVEKLESEIQKVKRKRTLLEKVANLKRKNAWMKFDEQKDRLDFLKKKAQSKQEHLKKKEKELEPIMKEISKAEQMFSNVENEMGRQNISARNDFSETRRMLQGIQELHDKVARIKSSLKQKIEVDSRVTVELRTLQNELDRIQNSIDAVDDTETNARLYEVEQKLNMATQENARITNEQDEKRHAMEYIRNELRAVNNKIEQLKNVLVKKLTLLESYDKDAYRVRKFIEENKDAFSGNIYGPMFVELNVGRNHAKYVESSISWNDRFAFICEEASDMTKLVQLCRIERKLKFNALKAPPNHGPAREAYGKPIPMSELRNVGLTAYLIDLVEGPEAILRYLCQNLHFHRIPIGSQAVLEERNAQRIADSSINTYYSDKQKIMLISSSYSRTKRQKAMLVKEATLFIHDGKADPKLEETAVKLMQNLNKDQSVLLEISTRRKETEERVNELFSERNALRKLKDNAKIMLTKQEKIRREILSLENSRIDRKSEEQRAYHEIKTVFLKCATKFEALVDNVNKGQDKMIRNTLLGKKSERLQDDIAAKKEAAKEASQELNTLKTEVADYNQKCVVLKKDADTARKEALAITDNLSPDHAEFGRRFAQAFAKLPDTADDIQQAIINSQAHADCLGVNEQAIVEYEKLKTNIVRLKDELQEKTDEFNALKARTGQIKQKWLDELSQLVVTINKSFSAVFRRMGCEGEVSLTNNGNEEDILKFGLTIRVKFRAEDELQELDIFRQSGGERAVTIAVYMLSLQELTHVPFRCLDEINQGMDEQNERRVFKTLVETVKRNTSSQYFLLTPKLLNGLKYADEVHSHVIMNGRGAVADREWSVVSERMARLGIKRRHSDSDSD